MCITWEKDSEDLSHMLAVPRTRTCRVGTDTKAMIYSGGILKLFGIGKSVSHHKCRQ